MRAAALTAFLAAICAACGGGGGSPPAAAVPPPPPAPNVSPVVSSPNSDVRAVNKHFFNYDVTQGGTTFSDSNGDRLTYQIEMTGPWDGLVASNAAGTISGILDLFHVAPDEHINVTVRASDGRGGTASASFRINIFENSPPAVSNPNLALVTTAGATVNRDLTQGGTTFTDIDGDRLTYEVALIAPSSQVSVVGLSVVGALAGVGAVGLRITAHDGFGASATDTFVIAVAADVTATPVLSNPPHVYEDAALPLPLLFRVATQFHNAFHDTTPDDNPTTNAGAKLGRVLFYDKRLSITNTLSCASCHVQARGFASPERFDIGILGSPLRRNSMGLTEVRYNGVDRYFADHRAQTLEGLALMPIADPTELGTPGSMLVEELSATSFYGHLFQEAFGTSEINGERISAALAQFLRSLISYSSRYDAAFTHSNGFDPADLPLYLTAQEIAGHKVFIDSSCGLCHDSDVQITGAARNTGLDSQITDPGHDGIGAFRAASLRNIELTAPYMHDGRFATLREVIDHYDHGVQDNPHLADSLRVNHNAEPRRLNLTEEQKQALEAFLLTLTDQSFVTDPKFSDPFF